MSTQINSSARAEEAVSNAASTDGSADNGLVLNAPAKINLYLEVLGERDDGYHEIRTVIAPISLYDTVRLELTADGVETVWENGRKNDKSLVTSEENLTTRAAVRIRRSST